MKKKRMKKWVAMLLAVAMLLEGGTQTFAGKEKVDSAPAKQSEQAVVSMMQEKEASVQKMQSNKGAVRAVQGECRYLSDMSYIEEQSFAAKGHEIHLDENENNDVLTLKVNETSTPFIKGLCAWATSEIVYDLSGYPYDYFSSYLGVDISEQNDYFNTGVKFHIYTSVDGEVWEEQYASGDLYGWSEAELAVVSITGAKYLKLVADDNSDSWWSEWYDEAVYADAKLYTEDYEEEDSAAEFIKTVDEYDAMIREYADHGTYEITGEYEALLLQREFVSNVGYNILQALAKYKTEYKETLEWLMGNTQVLRLYLTAGKPEGSYLNSIRVLADLYATYQEDLKFETKK